MLYTFRFVPINEFLAGNVKDLCVTLVSLMEISVSIRDTRDFSTIMTTAKYTHLLTSVHSSQSLHLL